MSLWHLHFQGSIVAPLNVFPLYTYFAPLSPFPHLTLLSKNKRKQLNIVKHFQKFERKANILKSLMISSIVLTLLKRTEWTGERLRNFFKQRKRTFLKLNRITDDSDFLKQIGHTVAESKLTLTGEESGKILVKFHLTFFLYSTLSFIEFHYLRLDVKKYDMEFVRLRQLFKYFCFLWLAYYRLPYLPATLNCYLDL